MNITDKHDCKKADPIVPCAHISMTATMEPAFTLEYHRWLDGLRGVAILLVLAFHFRLIKGGSLGVDVFFVLSGFLITSLLVAEWNASGRIKLGAFYARRALRLLPAFAFLLLAVFAATVLFESAESVAAIKKEIVVAALYVANWESLHHVPIPRLGATWSLSVEEQFYLVWPPVFFLMMRLRVKRSVVLAIVGTGIVMAMAWRGYLLFEYHSHGRVPFHQMMRLYTGSDTRADSLLTGCLLAVALAWNYVPNTVWIRRITSWLAWFSVAVLAYLSVRSDLGNHIYYNGLFTGVALMTAAIILNLLQNPAKIMRRVLETRVLVATGKISYGLYLFHIPMLHWFPAQSLGWKAPGMTALATGLTFAIALLSHRFLESPFLRLKHRFAAAGPTIDHSRQSECTADRQQGSIAKESRQAAA